jgi:hypothetical protein
MALALAVLLGLGLHQQLPFDLFPSQIPDPKFDARVARPAFRDRHPLVQLDEAHFNIHTARGTYRPFAELLTGDGYVVKPNRRPFSPSTLNGTDLLVIAGALHTRRRSDPEAGRPAFTLEEDNAVVEWVRQGGGLLITGDHPPLGPAVAQLLARFAIEASGGITIDTGTDRHMPRSIASLVFSRQNGLLGESALTDGRDSTERVSRVVVYTGNSFRALEGGITFLRASPTAWEVFPSGLLRTAEQFDSPPAGLMLRSPVRAAGRSLGVALRFGLGRVVAVGNGAMLTAMLYGLQREPKGMNVPGNDGRQLTLNIVHWLSGLLDRTDTAK